jgi:Anti-sigma regulatory factor (Ser/Thr protein kinase)
MADEVQVPIQNDGDIVTARQQGRQLAQEFGFKGSNLTVIASAISEMARNIVQYAGQGEIIMSRLHENRKHGILIIARDTGPGIPDIECAMRDGYSTRRSLGLGLPGARRLMDEFAIFSQVGVGTTVTMKKWLS